MAHDIEREPATDADTAVAVRSMPVTRRRRGWARWLLAALALVGIGGWALVAGSRLGEDPTVVRSPLIGKPAPAFALPSLDGGLVRSDQLGGDVLVVNFWASWCVPCREEAPHLEAFSQRWSEQGVRVVGIVYNDTEGRARAFRDEFGLTYPQVMDPDGRAAIDFGVFGVPETFVIDARGVVMAKLVGAVGPRTLDDVLARIEGGEVVTAENDRYRTQPG